MSDQDTAALLRSSPPHLWAPPPHLPGELSVVARVVNVADLTSGGSPRLSGLNNAHVERLAELEWPLAPILVHHPTMQIIDGRHRVAAAARKKIDKMDAYLIEGSLDESFVVAVQANITHGLPLSSAERRAAALRILGTHGEWSDRMIASSTGVSAKLVRRLRCATAENRQLHKRIGKDGRVRPLNPAEGRRRAAELLEATPNASLRAIASAAGVSPGTVRNVRARMNSGDNFVTPPSAKDAEIVTVESPIPSPWPRPAVVDVTDIGALLHSLSRDPALRMSDTGRELLRWLHLHVIKTVDGVKIASSAPEHCIPRIIELAQRFSSNWAEIANQLTAHYNSVYGSDAAQPIPQSLRQGTERAG